MKTYCFVSRYFYSYQCPGNVREISGKSPGDFRKISGRFRKNYGQFLEISGNRFRTFPGHFQQFSGNVFNLLFNFPKLRKPILGTIQTIYSLVWKKYRIFDQILGFGIFLGRILGNFWRIFWVTFGGFLEVF